MPRKVAADRREEIIEATARVLLRKGVSGATTRDVTAEIGVGVGLLSHYFGWFELRAIASQRILRTDLDRSLISRTQESASVVLIDFVSQAFDAQYDPIWRVWIEASDLASTDPALAVCVQDCSHLWRTGLCDLLVRGVADGDWACADPEGASWRLMAMIYGLAAMTLVPNAMLSRVAATMHLGVVVSHECDWKPPSETGKRTGRRTLKQAV